MLKGMTLPAQEKSLYLKHKSTGYVFEVDPEKAVKYKIEDGQKRRGYIEELSEDWMMIGGEKVPYDRITLLSSWHTRKNGGAKAGGAILTGFGGLLTTAGVIITVEGVNADDGLGSAIAVPIGAVATAVGLGSTYFGLRALKRKRFDMVEWDFVINNY